MATTEKLTKAQARDLTKRIGGLMGELEDLVVQAWKGFADEALGYPSWDEYITAEIPDLPRFNLPKRQAAVKKLTEETAKTKRGQMTAGEVGSTLGVSERTVESDRKATGTTSRSSNRKTAVATSTSDGTPKLTVTAAPEAAPEQPTATVVSLAERRSAKGGAHDGCDLAKLAEILSATMTHLKAHKFGELNAVDKRKVRTVYKTLNAWLEP